MGAGSPVPTDYDRGIAMPPRNPLPPPAVPAEVYDEDYYLHACAGYEEWRESGGEAWHGVYPGALQMAGFRAGETVVDVGTGRGEMLAVAVSQGAARAIGIEYSDAAVELARTTLSKHRVGDRAEVIHADARRLPLEDGIADLVTMLDIVEHLAPEEFDAALAEARRVLRPDGRVLIHTLPNRTIYEVTYRLQRVLWPARRRAWPADPRNDHERLMHVNEQTVTSLRRSLRRAGLAEPRAWVGKAVYDAFVPPGRARTTYHRFAAHRLTRRLGGADLWASARKR